ncbi:MAG: S1 RNA-binding domain-containing protein [Clostridium sp.]|jgi:predicted RNA-binding protein (virulence factor B family)
MIELGRVQELIVVREKTFGVYLSRRQGDAESVLLPKKQVPEGTKTGDRIRVFIYKDSEDRLIATTASPKLEVGETAVLKVRDVAKIGAFLDMGLEKDLLLPFKEQNHPVISGEECLVALYVDKSGRLAATMKVYPYLRSDSGLQKDMWTEGRVYELNDSLGVFVAVQDHYFGLIPRREVYENYRLGQIVRVRVTKVREDGKLDLSAREKAYQQIYGDAETILRRMDEQGGSLPFNDRVSPEIIQREFHLSKNAFKRAIGHLLKDGRIVIEENSIRQK